MSILVYIVACYLLVINPNEAARILAVFPMPSISHQVVFRPLTHELARRGHEVVVITADPAFKKGETPANLTEIDVHDISYKIWMDTFMEKSRGKKDDFILQMQTIADAMLNLLDTQLQDKQIQNLLQDKNSKFDLIFSEACVRPALIFSHVYKVPVIQVSSFGGIPENYLAMGAPTHPFLYPHFITKKLNNLTLWDKIMTLYDNYVIEEIFEQAKEKEHSVFKKYFGKDVPTMDELLNNVHMLFLNIFPIFDGIRPVPPSVVYMGGLHQKPHKELPADLKSYLDSSKNGVVYVSFGTNVDPTMLPPERIEILVKTFSKLPYDVLFKWNKDELPGRTANIRISKWLPQSDLLKHPKIKLFVTQGGLQSTDEAITAGVPLIGIPMLVDQWFNVEKYELHKIGIGLDLEALTEEKFTNAINTVIEDDSYRRNIAKLRELLLDEPMKPLDRAIWWTEYVLRHGGAKHLRSPAANITWTEYLELNLVFTVLGVLLTAVVLLILALSYTYKFVTRNFLNTKVKRA